MGALEGLKILDFSTLLPGPYATMMLADLGADVLNITGPKQYDLVTNWPPFLNNSKITAAQAWLGRNKKTIFLNLKQPKAAEAVKKLIVESGFNIILEQFRPGVMKKFGLDYDALKNIAPDLIYCSLTGYGQTGPMANRAGHDINYLARSGNMAAAGRKNSGPVLTNIQIADLAAGAMNTVAGILAAIYHRERTGEGQMIDISMFDGVLPFNGMDGISALAGGSIPQRENQLLNGGQVYDFYETADGRYMSVGSLEPKFFSALCRGLNLDETLLSSNSTEEIKKIIAEKFKSKNFSEWCIIFNRLDACVEPVMDLNELTNDGQVIAREMLPSVSLADGSDSITQFGCPIKLSKTPAYYHHAGKPKGYDTQKILTDLGYTAEEITLMNE